MSRRDPAGPVPTVAEVFGDTLVVTFDRELRNTSPDPANWFLSLYGQAYYCDAVEIDRWQVQARMVSLGPDPGPNRCAYAADPVDILSLDGVPAAAFDDFPIS